jgi:hypothetical protein
MTEAIKINCEEKGGEMNILKRLVEEIEKKNSWGKNELKELILKLLIEKELQNVKED